MKLGDKTIEELHALDKALTSDPANVNPNKYSIYMYTPATHKKLDKIARAISDKLIEKKKSAGTYTPASGYSGRQSNKRR